MPIQTTVSNHENSAQTNNVYLVVVERNNENNYEIKTTGNASFTNERPEHFLKAALVQTKDLRNFDQIIKTVGMDKKRRKNKKKKDLSKEVHDHVENNGHKGNTDVNVRSKSHVRIFGRLGVTDDNKYVLKCAATVNDTPVLTNFHRPEAMYSYPNTNFNHPEQHFVSPDSNLNCPESKILDELVPCRGNQNFRCPTIPSTIGCMHECNKNITYGGGLRNSFAQADIQNDFKFYKLDSSPMYGKESQGTQVNFNVDLERTINFHNKNQNIQCGCRQIINNNSNASSNEKSIALKECQSPLVIISVYPKQESSEAAKSTKYSTVQNTRRVSRQKTRESDQDIKQNANNTQISVNKKSIRESRSPSPAYRNFTKSNMQNIRENPLRTTFRKDSPGRQPAMILNLCSPQKKLDQSKKPKCKLLSNTKKEFLKSQNTVGTNTEHQKAKKAIIDSYTKKITATHMKHNNLQKAQNNPSKITINIDGENEYYDLLFHQGNTRTDLRVRKTIKDAMQTCCDDGGSPSMENLLVMSQMDPRRRSLSQTLYDDHSMKDMVFENRNSKLNVRDSLEIMHRREDNSDNNVKFTQTLRTKGAKGKTFSKNDTAFFAPVKHFKEDSCSIPDPLQRDREIRKLLGIDNGRVTSQKVNKHLQDQTHRNEIYSPQCFYGNNEENLIAGYSLYKCPCICCKSLDKHSNENIDADADGTDNTNSDNTDTVSQQGKTVVSSKKIKQSPDPSKKSQKSNISSKKLKNSTDSPPAASSAIERTSLYQQLILNRNIQVFLQVEQFTKQKPIVLSRKQYEKVKKTIRSTISKKISQDKRKKCICKASIVSVGEIRTKVKQDLPSHYNKEVQTDPESKTLRSKVTHSKKSKAPTSSGEKIKMSAQLSHDNAKCINKNQIYFSEETRNNEKNTSNIPTRQTVSSVEVCYASVAYMKHVQFSSTNIGSLSKTSDLNRNSNSLHTLFKGHRNPPTPNLGTSAYSLLSDGAYSLTDPKSAKHLIPPGDSKQKKPFLRRLMSCLVMRSTRASQAKIKTGPIQDVPSVNSSLDSYHINTSLGAVELSSSIYDTSASFYSNHSIIPINSKMKKGFFSSVRGFLTSR